MKADTFTKLSAMIADKRAVAVVTNMTTGVQSIVDMEEHEGELSLNDDSLGAVRELISSDQSKTLEDSDLFVRVYGPPLRMIIVGAVHIAQSLAPMAQLAGFEVTVIDPRDGFVAADRMAGFETLKAWPDEGMDQLKPDARTAIVTLTHDPKLDDPALHAALESDAFYIGALGSKRTHGKRIQRLESAGFDPKQLSRIHGPAGLNIKAKSPSEIALSILSEAIAVRRGAEL